jgi:hypothetical protein
MVRTLLMLALLMATPAQARQPAPRPILMVTVGPATERPPRRPDLETIELQVLSDGRFELEGRRGELPRHALHELRRKLAKTRLTLLPPARVNCMAIPVRRTLVKTQRGAVSWAAPCGRSPHLARHLLPETPTPEPTTLVSYHVNRHQGPMDGESLTLKSDGSWSHRDRRGARSGVLSPSELQTLRTRMHGVRVGPSPNPSPCAARYEGEGAIVLEGLGSYTFSVPCSELDPSLAAFLSELRALTSP